MQAMKYLIGTFVYSFFIIAILFSGLSLAENIKVEDAYVRESIPGNTVTSAYITLINPGAKPRQLIAVTGNFSPKIELHEHSMNNGMMQMRQVKAIDIPSKGRVQLQPFGLHIMVFDLPKSLKSGESVELILHFKDKQTQSLNVPVRSIKQQPHH